MQKQKRTIDPRIKSKRWSTYAKIAKPLLLKMSNNHCSYCDLFFENRDNSEIDHLLPKKFFPQLEFDWTNLFAVCALCNKQKGNHYSKLLIRPDDVDYDFFTYFDYDFATGEIYPNINLSQYENSQAIATIKILGFNKGDKPKSRKRFLTYIGTKSELYPDVSYRFLVECFDNYK